MLSAMSYRPCPYHVPWHHGAARACVPSHPGCCFYRHQVAASRSTHTQHTFTHRGGDGPHSSPLFLSSHWCAFKVLHRLDRDRPVRCPCISLTDRDRPRPRRRGTTAADDDMTAVAAALAAAAAAALAASGVGKWEAFTGGGKWEGRSPSRGVQWLSVRSGAGNLARP